MAHSVAGWYQWFQEGGAIKMANLDETTLSLHSHPEKKVTTRTNVTHEVMALHCKTEEYQKDQETDKSILCVYIQKAVDAVAQKRISVS
jgi:hypothetical protein